MAEIGLHLPCTALAHSLSTPNPKAQKRNGSIHPTSQLHGLEKRPLGRERKVRKFTAAGEELGCSPGWGGSKTWKGAWMGGCELSASL